MAKSAVVFIKGSGAYTVPAAKYAIVNVSMKASSGSVTVDGTTILSGSWGDSGASVNGIVLPAGTVLQLSITGGGGVAGGFLYDA